MNKDEENPPETQRALVLQGGGALGAYEVGVIKALYENLSKKKDGKPIFDVIAGSSIGAINGAFLVSHVKNQSWEKAVEELETFWMSTIKKSALVDLIPYFDEWWNYWHKKTDKYVVSAEAARRHYSAMQYYMWGAPGLLTSNLKSDNKFLNYPINFLYRTDWSSFGETLEEKATFPIKTNYCDGQPRLLTTTVDVTTGDGVIFDSYSEKSTYSDPEIVIKYSDGITVDHIMASAAVPANLEYVILEDSIGDKRLYWDGAFASNTPLRALIHHHRDYWHKKRKKDSKGRVPDLEVYIIGLWPRKKTHVPNPPDNNFVWDRMWDLLFEDKTTYIEKTSTMISDYLNLIKDTTSLIEDKDKLILFLEIKSEIQKTPSLRDEIMKVPEIKSEFEIILKEKKSNSDYGKPDELSSYEKIVGKLIEIPEIRDKLIEIPEIRDKLIEIPEIRDKLIEIPEIRDKLESYFGKDMTKNKIEKLQEEPVNCKDGLGKKRNKGDILKGRMGITVHRIEKKSFDNASSLKIYDFSEKTIKKLIQEGYDDGKEYLENEDQMEHLEDKEKMVEMSKMEPKKKH